MTLAARPGKVHVTKGQHTDRSLADRLHSVAIHVLRHARTADAAAGMSAARLSVLSVLVFGGSRTVTELADAEQVAVPTMTRLLQGLERDGFVRRRRSDPDSRVVRASVTPKGRRALESARKNRVRLLEDVTGALSESGEATVDAAIAALEAALVLVRSRQA